jgi:hypothetical protein
MVEVSEVMRKVQQEALLVPRPPLAQNDLKVISSGSILFSHLPQAQSGPSMDKITQGALALHTTLIIS